MEKFYEGSEFADFNELNAAIIAYQQQVHVVFTKINSRQVASANKNIKPGQPLYKDKFVFSFLKYGCKHYGKVRRSKMSKGIRKNQSSFKTGCPASFVVSANRKKDKMVMSRVNLEHNHEHSSEIYNHYPEVRRVDPDERQAVERLLSHNVEVCKIKDVFTVLGKKVTSRDIHNIRTKTQIRDKKMNKMHAMAERIATLSAELDEHQFCARYDLMCQIVSAFEKGQEIFLTTEDPEKQRKKRRKLTGTTKLKGNTSNNTKSTDRSSNPAQMTNNTKADVLGQIVSALENGKEIFLTTEATDNAGSIQSTESSSGTIQLTGKTPRKSKSKRCSSNTKTGNIKGSSQITDSPIGASQGSTLINLKFVTGAQAEPSSISQFTCESAANT